MTYKSKARRKEPELRTPIPNSGKLAPGQLYPVRIVDIAYTTSKVKITFKTDFDESHEDSIFLLSQNKSDLGGIMKQLIGAIANDSEELRDIYNNFLESSFENIPDLRGRRCQIDTQYNGEFVNIKSVRGYSVTSKDSNFFQSTPPNTTQPETSKDSGPSKKFIPLSEKAATFF